MSVIIKSVSCRKELKTFVNFPLSLYKDMPGFVPSLFMDEMNTLDPSKNPAYDFCESRLFLAYKDGKLVGRVAAILNNKANERWHHDEIRYGWFDFIDDPEVSKALIDAVCEFGREKGMSTITGPLGFTDFDPEGMLVEGYDCISTMALHHNWPYYKDHMEAMGFEKEVDWLEYKVYMPDVLPDRYHRIATMVKEKYGLHVRKVSRKEVIKGGFGYKIFDLVNETYGSLYNFTILPKKVVESYIDLYLSLIDLRFISLVEDSDNNLVGFGISMPSITRALQKCKGKLFPFGWFHVLRSMYFKYEENVELLLIGIKPEYQKKGVNALIFDDLLQLYQKCGFKYAETNAELENNYNILTQWNGFDTEQTKRRRVYSKSL